MSAEETSLQMKIRSAGKTIEMEDGGDRLVFRVGEYRVDLEAAGGRGWCDCEDFRFRVKRLREKGFRDAECKHIRQTRAVLGSYFAKRVAHQAGVRRPCEGDP